MWFCVHFRLANNLWILPNLPSYTYVAFSNPSAKPLQAMTLRQGGWLYIASRRRQEETQNNEHKITPWILRKKWRQQLFLEALHHYHNEPESCLRRFLKPQRKPCPERRVILETAH